MTGKLQFALFVATAVGAVFIIAHIHLTFKEVNDNKVMSLKQTRENNESSLSNIFFVEASKTFNFSDLWWCTIESAARTYPDVNIRIIGLFHKVNQFIWCKHFSRGMQYQLNYV